ncbi:MAG: hypothetical protein QOK43_1413 [Acidimicrobiaceae bacterium]|nr:hypothetical protein [Acidimicrobiaceae bacterium]
MVAAEPRRPRSRAGAAVAAMAPTAGAFVVALVLGLVALAHAHPFVVGDEPHYVVMASSLVHDHDLDLANDYGGLKGGSSRAFPTMAPDIHAFHYRAGGPLAPVHGPGMAVLLAPFIAVRETMYSARVGMVVMFAAFAAALLSLLRALAGRRSLAAVVVWACVMAALPVVVFSFEVYPDMPGALFVALALRALVSRRFTPLHALAAGLCAAWLPFLHVRFGILAVPLVAAAVVRSVRAAGVDSWTALGSARRRTVVGHAAPAAVLFLLGMAALAAVFVHLYGSPLPGAPYRIEPFLSDNRFTLLKAYRFGFGSLLGFSSGMIPYAPVFWFGVVGVAAFTRRVGWRLVAAVGVVAAAYLLVVGGHGPVVNAFPGRTMLVFLPVLAIGMLGAVQSSRTVAVAVVLTAAVGAAVSYQGVRHLELVYDVAEVRLPLERRLAPAFPWFSVPAGGVTAQFELSKLERTTGRVSSEGGTEAVEAEPTTNAAGLLARTPPFRVRPGMYDVSLVLTTPAPQPVPERVLDVQVLRSFDGVVYAHSTVWSADVPVGAPWRMRFMVPDLQQFEIRLDYTGAGSVRATQAVVGPAGTGPLPIRTADSDLALTVLWLGMTAVAMALFARARPALEDMPCGNDRPCPPVGEEASEGRAGAGQPAASSATYTPAP